MGIKRTAAAILLIGIVGFLLFREFSQWAKFDWGSFWRGSRSISILPVLAAVGLIYSGYAMRALRWKILLSPLQQAATLPLLRATVIGFAAMALLGRPAELIRPYLIARQERLSPSSQFAIWIVERFFDLGAFATLLLSALLFSPSIRGLPHLVQFHRSGLWLAGLLAAGAVAITLMSICNVWFRGQMQRLVSAYLPGIATRAGQIGAAFRLSLSGLLKPLILVQVVAISLLMWATIAFAYLEVLHAFRGSPHGIGFSGVLLLMGFSMAGSLIQLPGGGVSQLITIAVLSSIFSIPVELAVSCGILLWLATYMAPVPVGLALLRKEHLSFKFLARESTAMEAQQPAV
jgi:uncharacterized membrane protein YbhN (UPF0104 family)